MLGFDPLTLSAAYILASMSASQCPTQGPVDVEVQFVQRDNPIITNMTSAQLTQREMNNPNATMATDGKWMVGGVTVVNPDSGLKDDLQFGFQATTEIRTGAACFAVNKVIYTITYSPDVYIASDFLNMGCRYSATLMHEKRHVNTDIRILTDYVPEMRKAIQAVADSLGPQGPYAVGDLEVQKQRVGQELAASLKPQWEQLLTLRRQKQAEIDTVQNYLRDTALCPGQFPKFDGSK